ncbi:uncharacterized protein LOC142765751 [Rhipicephalus microplus]|uniref:uncharacterized protein LOC142765751 n=1 Tax=Rhipicephalus microplus TaxID=6941 RepID=UPI003F6C200F
MYGRGNPLPLRHRRPQLCAEMEAAAAAREWSPVDVYWDPRYHSFFYAGANDDAQYTVEFDQEGLDERDPASAPILLQAGRGRRRRKRRITWTDEVPSADVVPEADVVPVAEGTQRPEYYWTMWILAMLAVLVLLVIAVFIVWLWGYLLERRGLQYRGADSISANEGLGTAASAARAEVIAFTKGQSDPGESEAARGADDYDSNDTDTTENPPKQATSRRRDITEHSGTICLYTDRDRSIDTYETVNQKQMPPGAQHCGLLIKCCYILERNMTFRSEASRTHASKLTSLPHDLALARRDVTSGRSPEILMAVREQESAFQRLLASGDQWVRDDFVRNAAFLARSDHYAGLRLWWKESRECSIVVHGFLRAVKHIAIALRKANCTLGFFVPYAAAHEQPKRYAVRLRTLDKVLGSKASLLLYPTTSVLGNVSEWPTPSRVMGDENSMRTPSGHSICHLFLPTTAVSVMLANASQSCDPNRVQRVTVKSEFMSVSRLSKLCLSWNPSPWKVSRRRYCSYACGFGEDGKKGIVFQTPQQASRYGRKLLARTGSTCFGYVGEEREFPHDCLSSPLFVSGTF